MVDHEVDVINMSLSWTWSGPGDGTSPYTNSPAQSGRHGRCWWDRTWVNSCRKQQHRTTWFGEFSDDEDGERIARIQWNLTIATIMPLFEGGELHPARFVREGLNCISSCAGITDGAARIHKFKPHYLVRRLNETLEAI